MKLRKIAALVGSAALALTLIGAGVGATFTATSATTDTISVGTMAIVAHAQNTDPNGHAVNTDGGCTINVTASTGSQPCYVWVTKTGTIIPNSLALVATVSSGGVSEPGLWAVSDGANSGPLSGALAWTYASPTFPSPLGFQKIFTVSWNNLTVMGDNFVITFTATASA
jgi:hypothetical protein